MICLFRVGQGRPGAWAGLGPGPLATKKNLAIDLAGGAREKENLAIGLGIGHGT